MESLPGADRVPAWGGGCDRVATDKQESSCQDVTRGYRPGTSLIVKQRRPKAALQTLSIAVNAIGRNSAQGVCVDRPIQAVESGPCRLGIFDRALLGKRQGAGFLQRVDQ